MTTLFPVILCGGSGTRLWPLSRELHPKQFVDMGSGRTLFKDTLKRIPHLTGAGLPLIVCNDAHRFFVSTSLLECSTTGTIILEPAPRNTAPAIALAVFAAQEQAEDDPLLLVMPSDQMIQNANVFAQTVEKARLLAESGAIVTFGVTPDKPETGFGYIKQGTALSEDGYAVARFIEKPPLAQAEAMLAEGGYTWNSGIFMFRASVFLRELETFAPEMFRACKASWKKHTQEGAFYAPEADSFLGSPANSIDYSIMERTALAAVCPMSTGWNDLGSWEALYQVGEKDASENVSFGDILQKDVHNCYLHGTHRLIAAVGVSNLAVIETQDAVLVADRAQVQDVKAIVETLKANGRREYKHHPLVYRPWGCYESLALDTRFQVKRITVNPGAELSLQIHYHRAEHWVIVSGTAEVTNGGSVNLFTENQSTYIPVGTPHRLKNPGSIPLIIIEIQSGSYLGEDDIVRLQDTYGRK